jgi:hypothetical protein
VDLDDAAPFSFARQHQQRQNPKTQPMTDAKQTQPPTSSNDPGFVEMLQSNYNKASEAEATKNAIILRRQIADIDDQLVAASNAGRNYIKVHAVDGYYVNDLQQHYDKIGLKTKNFGTGFDIQFMVK